MPKAYWLTFYSSVTDPSALAEYGKLAVPAIQAGGGRILARGAPARVYERGRSERTVVIEFDSVAQAIATYEGPAYQAALRLLDEVAEREVRFLEGVT